MAERGQLWVSVDGAGPCGNRFEEDAYARIELACFQGFGLLLLLHQLHHGSDVGDDGRGLVVRPVSGSAHGGQTGGRGDIWMTRNSIAHCVERSEEKAHDLFAAERERVIRCLDWNGSGISVS